MVERRTDRSPATSVDKALEVCEALSGAPGGMSLAELARLLRQPRPTIHRLLGVLKRRGYVRQDDGSARYHLTLRMLDLSFRALGRSELRLHALPVVREHVMGTGARAFVAIPGAGEVTYVWTGGGDADEPAMQSLYAREMPAHCARYFNETAGSRRLSCLKLEQAGDLVRSAAIVERLGPHTPGAGQCLFCTCAPVRDYTGREVARIGLFGHGPDDRPLLDALPRAAWELGQHVSLRLGHLPANLATPPA